MKKSNYSSIETIISTAKKGGLVNVEIDILSKYVKNFFYEKK